MTRIRVRRPCSEPSQAPLFAHAPVQRRQIRAVLRRQAGAESESSRATSRTVVHDTAAGGVGGPATAYPHLARIQRAFGAHDLGHASAHMDAQAGDACRDLGAMAYTTGSRVAFRGSPDLYTAAHEAAHVVQQQRGVHLRGGMSQAGDPYERHADAVAQAVVSGRSAAPLLDALPAGAPGQAAVQRRACTSKDDPEAIITSHTVSPDTIQKPGDKVTITVDFACDVRDGESYLETKGGTSLDLKKFFSKSNQYTRTWDGKKQFTGIGTYLVDDGEYRHRLENVTYAYKYNSSTKTSDNVYASGSKLISPEIKVRARGYAGAGKEHRHYSAANVTALAAIIVSEMGVGNDTEKRAIAWAVRNQMIRLNTDSVTTARDHFNDAHGDAATADARTMAEDILKKPMSGDTSGGAIKWFSPRSMPGKGESCSGKDCGGGLITVNNAAGKAVQVYAPTWHKTMTHVAIAGARDWYVRFYRL
jgi:hypothetical protein